MFYLQTIVLGISWAQTDTIRYNHLPLSQTICLWRVIVKCANKVKLDIRAVVGVGGGGCIRREALNYYFSSIIFRLKKINNIIIAVDRRPLLHVVAVIRVVIGTRVNDPRRPWKNSLPPSDHIGGCRPATLCFGRATVTAAAAGNLSGVIAAFSD